KYNVIYDPNILAKMSKQENNRYYKIRVLSDGYSLFTKPFFPVHNLKPEVIKEFSCPQYSTNHFSWCAEDETLGNRSLYLQNLKTSRSIEVCNSLSARSFPTLTENFVAWDDNRDISSSTYPSSVMI
ncbi:MAG: hypothetical protein KAH30_02705, partial [Caldisericia bacterium]|nr:hypothetical protein [Caldisericia bacterium]